MFDDLQNQSNQNIESGVNARQSENKPPQPLTAPKEDISQRIKALEEHGKKQGKKKIIYSAIGIVVILLFAGGIIAAGYYYWPEITVGFSELIGKSADQTEIDNGSELYINQSDEQNKEPEIIENPDQASETVSASSTEENMNLDSDKDGLTDVDEMKYGTDANNPDSDGDGYLDGEEVKNGFNPMGEGKLDKSISQD